jgi:hypothetical protein
VRGPRVVPDEGRGGGRDRAVPQAAEPVDLDALAEDAPAALALRLQRRLERVHGREDHPEERGRERGEHGLEQLRQLAQEAVRLCWTSARSVIKMGMGG